MGADTHNVRHTTLCLPKLAGIRRLPDDLHISDQKQFLESVPALIEQFRLRWPASAWHLNLSRQSLKLLDTYLDALTDDMIAQGKDIADHIDRSLLQELTAYLGEVIVHSQNGWWRENPAEGVLGPYIVFRVAGCYIGDEPYFRGLDIYDHMLTLVLEGESFAKWFEQEISNIP